MTVFFIYKKQANATQQQQQHRYLFHLIKLSYGWHIVCYKYIDAK